MHLKATRTLIFLFAVALFSSLACGERIQDLPTPTNYVSDLAGVLSAENQQALNQYCSEVDHQAHAQIAVVTIKTLDGEDPSDYAVKLEEAWKVGPKGSDRGVILLLAAADHKYRIEVGYGLEGILPDGKVGDIGRSMVPALRAGNYDDAVNLVVSRIGQTIAADAGVSLERPASVRGPPVRRGGFSLGRLIFYGIILLVFLVFSSRARGGGLLGFLLGMFLGGGGRWGGGGGGFGGGGGGDSGGGGFGGFGGGSSGGGGASGDW